MEDVHIILVRSFNRDVEVITLLLSQFAQFGIDMVQMQQCNLLIQNFGQHVDADILLSRLAEFDVAFPESFVFGFEEHDLREHLVGEGARHDERGVAGCAAKIHESAFSKENDVSAVRHEEAVNLGFDVLGGFSVGLEPGDVDFDVEVANVLIPGLENGFQKKFLYS